MALSATGKIIREAIDLAPMGPSLDAAADALASALDEMGYTIREKPKPRTPAAPTPAFSPATGDAGLDEFMRTHHRTDWQTRLKKACARSRPGMMTMPAPAPGIARDSMTQQERADLWVDHNVIQHSN